ncbi:MAG TPA: ABC transporter permease [Anaerolineales bacterium]|nr:ABC transporter permease [Anaerolineales bacterium]
MTGTRRGLRFPYRLERRSDVGRWAQLAWLIVAIVAALIASGLLLLTAGADVVEAFGALFGGGFGGWREILETLVRATPLILTGLAAALAFRAKVWNIGGEGQLFAGAMAGYWAFTLFAGLPPVALFLVVIAAAAAGGAAVGWLAALLKTRFNVDEIISTVMMNYIVMFFLSLMLSGVGPWREQGSYYQQSAMLPESAQFLVLLPRSRLHVGFLLAVLAAMAIHILLTRTPLGYEIRAIGFNPTAARFKGTNVPKVMAVTLAISGALAGLAGAGELFGLQHRLVMDLSNGLGYTGIIVAMLANLHPLGVVLAAILFGGLTNGAFRLQVATGVPSAFTFAIQAIVLLFVISASILSSFRVRTVSDVD